MQDPVPKPTLQAAPKSWGLDPGTVPKVLQRLHQFGCMASIIALDNSKEVITELKKKKITL